MHTLLFIDNTTAITYINSKGGTHSRPLSDLALQMWEWCRRNISLHAEHIAGQENEGTATESREAADSSDWRLHPETFQQNGQRCGPLNVDPFAARHNAQILQFSSGPSSRGNRCSVSNTVNALTLRFSPIGRTLQNIRREAVPESLIDLPCLLPQSLPTRPESPIHYHARSGHLPGCCQGSA